jgi:hypothetical protein
MENDGPVVGLDASTGNSNVVKTEIRPKMVAKGKP